jgi:hypothetical protein
MRTLMTSLAIVWLAGIGIMMWFQGSRYAAFASDVAPPAREAVYGRQPAPNASSTEMYAGQGRVDRGRGHEKSR